MRRIGAWVTAVTLLAVLSGCSGSKDESRLRLWYTVDLERWDNETTALESTPYTGEETVPALMEALLAGPPKSSQLVSPFPQDTELQQWKLEGGQVTVDLSWPYSDLAGIELTMADYCITLTLTQLEGVEAVSITSNGSPLSYRDQQVFTREDVMFTGAEEEPVEVAAALCFRRRDSQELGFEFRTFRLTESDLVARVVLEALLAGPQDEGLEQVLPPGVEIRSVRQEGKNCYVDLSAAFVQEIPEQEWEQRMVVDAVVNTLCSLENVEQVQLLVEGEVLEWYGDIPISQPTQSQLPEPRPT